MLFTRPIALVLAVMSTLAVATPILESRGGGGGGSEGNSCSTGKMQCCNQLQSASDPSSAALAGLFGLPLGVIGQVGLGCSPLTVVGVGNGNSCSANAVCCQNNNTGGAISTGCIPISL